MSASKLSSSRISPALYGDGADGDEAIGPRIQARRLRVEHDEADLIDWRVVRPRRLEGLLIAGDEGRRHQMASSQAGSAENSSSRWITGKPLLRTCRSWRLSSAGGSSAPVRALTDSDTALLPEDDPQRVGGVPEDLLVRRQQAAGDGKSIEGRRPHHVAPGHAEHPAQIDQRSQRAVFETEHRRLLTALLDDGVLVERQRRKACEAIVREHLDDVAVDSLHDALADLAPQRPRPVERAQIEERTAARHLFDHRVLDPGSVAPAPFGRAGDRE